MSGKEKVLRVHLKTQSYNSVKTIRVQEKAKNVEIIKEVGPFSLHFNFTSLYCASLFRVLLCGLVTLLASHAAERAL